MKKGDLVRVNASDSGKDYDGYIFCNYMVESHGYLWIILHIPSEAVRFFTCKSLATGYETSFTSGELEQANEEG